MNRISLILALFSLAALPAYAQSERTLIREGNRHYNENKFDDAEVSYKKALEKNKELHEGAFNLGDALYKQDRFGEAAEQYQIAATRTKDASEKAQALHNLGNSYVKSQQYPQAISAYKGALKANPNDADTKYNLEYAKQMLKQQQQQEQKKQDKNDKQKQDKNDQQKKQEDKKNEEQKKEDQQKQDEQKNADQKNQKQESQPQKQQISKQDAERILEALKNEEKDVQKKIHKRAPARVRVEKDW